LYTICTLLKEAIMRSDAREGGLNVTIRKDVERKVVTSLNVSAYVSRGWGLKKMFHSYL